MSTISCMAAVLTKYGDLFCQRTSVLYQQHRTNTALIGFLELTGEEVMIMKKQQ